MELGDIAALRAEGGWRDALRGWRDNPLYQRLSLSRRRQQSAANQLGRFAPLLIALIPAGITTGALLITAYNPGPDDVQDALKSACVAYIITACTIWFVQGFHQAVLDCMLLLNRSQRKQATITVDDLSAVSALSDHEIAVGALAAILPGLWLRVFVTMVGGMAVYIAITTNFLADIDNEKLMAIGYALPTVCLLTLGSILATTALALYLMSLSENYSFTLASATAVLYSLGALFWIPVSVGMALFLVETTGRGPFYSHIDQQNWTSALMMGPLAFIVLVWLTMALTRTVRWLRPVYALGSPWLNPILLFIVLGAWLALNSTWFDDETTGLVLMMFIYQCGAYAPLSITHLPTFALLGFDSDMESMLTQLSVYGAHLLTQLVLIFVCATYAVRAIGSRRQSTAS